MSPSDAERLDQHAQRLQAIEMQAALDKQSRQNMHRSIDAMNMTVANLNADFKAFMADYHENKTDIRLASQDLKALAEKIEGLNECKADKLALAAVDLKADTISKTTSEKLAEVQDNQKWALRGAIGALLAAVGALWKAMRG